MSAPLKKVRNSGEPFLKKVNNFGVHPIKRSTTLGNWGGGWWCRRRDLCTTVQDMLKMALVAPALWNALPSDVKEINNYLTFRKHLKAALFREVLNV